MGASVQFSISAIVNQNTTNIPQVRRLVCNFHSAIVRRSNHAREKMEEEEDDDEKEGSLVKHTSTHANRKRKRSMHVGEATQ